MANEVECARMWRGAPGLLSTVVWLVVCGCGPAPTPNAPRRMGSDSRAFVGQAELLVRYRYLPLPRFEIDFMVDLSATGGGVGDVAVEVKPEGFDVMRGDLEWSASLRDGDEQSETLRLRAGGNKTPRITVVTRRGEGGVDLATDRLRFIIAEDVVRECRATDACPR